MLTAIARQRFDQLVGAVEELPSRCREIFILRKVEHLRAEQIALRLGISHGEVEKQLRKVLLRCHDCPLRLRNCATAWAVRVDGGHCSAMDWRELERWLVQGKAHRVAFESACSLWIELDEVADEVDLRATARSSRRARGPAGPRWVGGRRWLERARQVCRRLLRLWAVMRR